MLFVEQSYSVHSEKVTCMCRICGERVKRQTKDKLTPLKLCKTYVKELSIYPGLDTTHDKEDEHSKGMSQNQCYQRLTSCKHASNSAKSDASVSFYRTEFHRERITPKQHLLEHRCVLVLVWGTLWASLSGTFLQTLPDLVTPLKGHSLSRAAVHCRGQRPPKGSGTDKTVEAT